MSPSPAGAVDQLRARAHDSIAQHGGGVDEGAFAKLAQLLLYVDGDYNDPATFEKLRKALHGATRPVHYLAVPPSLFGNVVEALGKSGSAQNARIIIEKPFGHDLASAQKLNAILHSVFPESAIFRIDHYLGKEAVENLLFFRFANTFLEPIWNRNYVHSVQITMAEPFGVAGPRHILRSSGSDPRRPPKPYTSGGESPGDGAADDYVFESLHDEKVKVFRMIPPLNPAHMCEDSSAATATSRESRRFPRRDLCRLRLEVDSWRWAAYRF